MVGSDTPQLCMCRIRTAVDERDAARMLRRCCRTAGPALGGIVEGELPVPRG
jgi:hypothetical protein